MTFSILVSLPAFFTVHNKRGLITQESIKCTNRHKQGHMQTVMAKEANRRQRQIVPVVLANIFLPNFGVQIIQEYFLLIFAKRNRGTWAKMTSWYFALETDTG